MKSKYKSFFFLRNFYDIFEALQNKDRGWFEQRAPWETWYIVCQSQRSDQ